MKITMDWKKAAALAATFTVGLCDISLAAEDDVTVWVSRSGPRWEAALGVQSWPGLTDLDIASEGSFDNVGFSLSLAAHWPYKNFGRSELLAGIDLGFISHESDIRFTSDSLVARNAYITPSVKWMFANRYSFDAGFGYYILDMAEIVGEYPAYWETQLWEDGSAGGYIGATFDFPTKERGQDHGVTLNVKIHFVDFGRVQDEFTGLPETLGPDAGNLSGPIYALQLGYRWR